MKIFDRPAISNIFEKSTANYMYLPDPETESLIFEKQTDFDTIGKMFTYTEHLNTYGDFANINWLNTPGPIYTTTTDNCGTGQIEALNNVGGDENYHEVIFKQPINVAELNETISAAICDPFGAYYFDGNQNWNTNEIIDWWSKSEERLNYIVANYKYELELPEHPHVTSWKIGDEIFSGQLFGPPKPIPENYKSWLDFYQFGMKDYLVWYVFKIENRKIYLPRLKYDWTAKEELDALFNLRQSGRK